MMHVRCTHCDETLPAETKYNSKSLCREPLGNILRAKQAREILQTCLKIDEVKILNNLRASKSIDE